MKRFVPSILSVALFVTACASPAASPTPTPSPSSTAAFQACHAILDSIPGLTAWVGRGRVLVPDGGTIDFVGQDLSERNLGYQLLKLKEDFGTIRDAIILRSADIRQQGPGCIAVVDALRNFARGLDTLAAQRLVCALVGTQGNFFTASSACTDPAVYANASSRLAPWWNYDATFADPTSEELQSLRPWPEKLGEGTRGVDMFMSDTANNVCEVYTSAFQVNGYPLAMLMEYFLGGSYPALFPELPENELPTITRDMYFGTAARKSEIASNVDKVFKFTGQSPLIGMRFVDAPEFEQIGASTLCAGIAEQVDLIGRAPGDTASPYSSGYYGVVASGIAGCASGAFGSDQQLCYKSRVFDVLPKLITALLDLNVEFGRLSSFKLVSELQ